LYSSARAISATRSLSTVASVWLYQLSDEGLVADLTIEGTKYFKDPELN